MSILDALPGRYRLILCDLWGCVHDGRHLLPGVLDRLEQWKAEGRAIVFLTNAPRSAGSVRAQLDRVGLPRGLESAVVTAGEAGAAELRGRTVGFLGTEDDRRDLEARGLSFVDEGFDELACAGLAIGDAVAHHEAELRRWREADVLMHCLNPDRIVIHCGEIMVCAGALADAYEAMGGRVRWYGKPHPAIYEYALRIGGSPPKEAVVAIGDGLQTDVLGAAAFGIDCIFVTGGIHAGDPFPHDFGERHGLGHWEPLAVVPAVG